MISPGNIDDLIGLNFSKINAKLNEILEMIRKYSYERLKVSEPKKELRSNFLKIYNKYKEDYHELLLLNLNYYETVTGNVETLLYLRDGK